MMLEDVIKKQIELFTGRKEALQKFDEVIDRYMGGRRTPVVIVEGPSESGKTFLLTYVIRTRIQPFYYNYVRVDCKLYKNWFLALKKIASVVNKYEMMTPTFDAYVNELNRKVFEGSIGTNLTAKHSGLMFSRHFLRSSVSKAYNFLLKRFPEYFKDLKYNLGEATPYEVARVSPLALAVDISAELRRLKEKLIIIIDHIEELDDIEPLMTFLITLQGVLVIISTNNHLISERISKLLGDVLRISLNKFSKEEAKIILNKILRNPRTADKIVSESRGISEAIFKAFLYKNKARSIEDLPSDLKDEISLLFNVQFVKCAYFDKINFDVPIINIADEEEGIIIPIYKPEDLILTSESIRKLENIIENSAIDNAIFLSLLNVIDPIKSLNKLEELVDNYLKKGKLLDTLMLIYLSNLEFKGASEKLRYYSILLTTSGIITPFEKLEEILKNSEYLKDADVQAYIKFLASYIVSTAGASIKKVFDIVDTYRAAKKIELYPDILYVLDVMLSMVNIYGRFDFLEEIEKMSEQLMDSIKRSRKLTKEKKQEAKTYYNRILVKLARAYDFLDQAEDAKKIILKIDLDGLLDDAIWIDAALLKMKYNGYDESSYSNIKDKIRSYEVYMIPRLALLEFLRINTLENRNERIKVLDDAISEIKLYTETLGWKYIDSLLEMGRLYMVKADLLRELERTKEVIATIEAAVEQDRLAVDFTRGTSAEAYISLINSYIKLLNTLELFGKKSEINKRLQELLEISKGIMEKLVKAEIFSVGKPIERIIYNLARSYISMSEILVRGGDLKKAVERANAAIDVFRRLGREGEEVREAFFNLGKIYMRLGDYAKALEFLDKTATKEAKIWKAETLKRIDELDKMREELEKLSEEDSSFYRGVALYYIAEIAQDENPEMLDNLIEEADKLIFSASTCKDRLFFVNRYSVFRGKLFERKGDLSGAIMYYERARELIRPSVERFDDPLYLVAYGHTLYSMGKAYRKMRNKERAESELKQAIEHLINALKIVDWRDPYALGVFLLSHVELAKLYVRMGMMNEAKISIEEALKQGRKIVGLTSNVKAYIYYSRALQEACKIYLRAKDNARLKELFNELKIVVKKELDMKNWRDVLMLDTYVNVLEEIKKFALNEFADALIDELAFLEEKLVSIIDEVKSSRKFSKFLEVYGKIITMISDILWKKTRFDEAYAYIDKGINLLSEYLPQLSDEERAYVQVHLFNMMVMKSTMKYFGEGDIETLENYLDKCEEIARETLEKILKHPERFRLLADVNILKARRAIFLKDYEEALKYLVEAKNNTFQMRKINLTKASRYSKIITRIINYALASREMERELSRRYISLKKELRKLQR